MNTLVVTPCKIEFESALQSLKAKTDTAETVGAFNHELYFFPELNIYLGMGGHGKVEYALKVQSYLNRLTNIKRVYCAGAAGGISPKRKIFDIIFAQTTFEHDYKERFDNDPVPEFACCPQALKQAEQKESLIIGKVASGDEDIICSQRAKELFDFSQADVVAWEGAGGARACRMMNVPFVEIRGVSDVANHDAAQDFAANVKVVMPKIIQNILEIELALINEHHHHA